VEAIIDRKVYAMTEQSAAVRILVAQIDAIEDEPANVTKEMYDELCDATARLRVLTGLLDMRYGGAPAPGYFEPTSPIEGSVKLKTRHVSDSVLLGRFNEVVCRMEGLFSTDQAPYDELDEIITEVEERHYSRNTTRYARVRFLTSRLGRLLLSNTFDLDDEHYRRLDSAWERLAKHLGII
jgi:hypothetical protein